MKAAELRAVTMRLDVLRDIMLELVAALPPDRAAGFAAALGNRLNGRICDMEIDERSDNAMVSDLAPPGSTPTASFGLSFACATNQINNLQQERQIV
jgi:hypothetical protein